MKNYLPFVIVCAALNFTGCTTIATHFPGVYAIDVEQGNIIDQEMIDQLRPNMNKRQVLYVMGTPMLVDVFNQERWDYIYSIQPGGDDRRQKRISLFFENDTLAGVKGDFRPSRTPVPRPSHETTVDVPKRVIEKTLYQKITSLFSSDDVNQAIQTTEQAATEVKNLEPSSESLPDEQIPEQNADDAEPNDEGGLQSYPLPSESSATPQTEDEEEEENGDEIE